MGVPLTARDFDEYRRLRTRHLIYGKRVFSADQWAYYQALDKRVRAAVGDLSEPHRTVARLYYVNAMTCVAVGMRTYYSERHVRRIRDVALKRIVMA